jgi:hypothetical protein
VLDKRTEAPRKLLTDPETHKFDFGMVAIIFLTAINLMAILFGIGFNLKMAQQAGLNMGIAQAIWAINPFFQSLLDLLLWKSVIRTHHWLGMIAFVFAGVIISLSNVFG